VHGGFGPSFAVRGAGHLSSIAGGVAGHLSFFVGGGAGCLSHCSWVVVVVVHPHQFSCGVVHGPCHCHGGPVIT